MMLTKIPTVMIAVLVLVCIPVQLHPKTLKKLAFSLWMMGGGVLITRGGWWLFQQSSITSVGLPWLLGIGSFSLLVGYLKGRFILSKTSAKNVERIKQMDSPQFPIKVYGMRSWAVISVMVLLAISLNMKWIPLETYIRGAINFAVGFALFFSSFAYLKD